MNKEKSCGIIVFNDDKVLVIKHNKGHFGFPKGHVEPGETEHETAKREVKEETNIDALIIDGFRDYITYSPKEKVIKDVIYFVGNAVSFDLKNQEKEVSNCLFVPSNEVLDLLTFEDEKNIFKKALTFKENLNDKESN
jgi:8-oxo-dGTP pyrophosphatase MutT (NUDIX family)